MASLTVRVVPRAGRTAVEMDDDGVRVRVRSPPEGGKATAEAAKALARALGVAPSSIALRTGARSRTKVFEVVDLAPGEPERRLRREGENRR
jgi:uncharacterized protein